MEYNVNLIKSHWKYKPIGIHTNPQDLTYILQDWIKLCVKHNDEAVFASFKKIVSKFLGFCDQDIPNIISNQTNRPENRLYLDFGRIFFDFPWEHPFNHPGLY